MILGIGNDLIDIRRIEKLLAAQGARFEKKIFTESERVKAASRKKAGAKAIAATYAKRFAAKEACAKALGCGIGKDVAWHDMEVTSLKSGAPTLTLRGNARKKLAAMTPKGSTARLLLALTDEYPFALAQVVIVTDE
jgi:holo-[acyl-carrier protein] synthase